MATMKKRSISLFVENEVGVLAYISGLFSGKSYNVDSLTVGTTIDPTISRMTIRVTSDDQTFEQITLDSDRDRWFTAQQAKDYGLVDHVISHAEGPISN